ncbi:MAG: hypothetical protein AB7H90_11420 [Alphaproteobacteria bacterium]
MRGGRFFAAACAVAVCMQAVPARAVGPGNGPGCLGVAVTECVAWLRMTMTLDENFLAQAMARRHEVDVNGQPLGRGLVVVNGRLPERPEQFVLLLHLGTGDTVRRVESNLTIRLTDARTEAVYDQSGFYEIVWRVLGRRCPGIAKLDLYRFFENSVKPRIRQEQQDLSKGLWGVHRLISHAAGVPYCGVSFGYTGMTEWRGSSDIRSGRNFRDFAFIALE